MTVLPAWYAVDESLDWRLVPLLVGGVAAALVVGDLAAALAYRKGPLRSNGVKILGRKRRDAERRRERIGLSLGGIVLGAVLGWVFGEFI